MSPRAKDNAVVAICGAAGHFGRLLVRRLHRSQPVVAIDDRPFLQRPADVAHRQSELKSRHTRNLFRRGGIHTVIYIGGCSQFVLGDGEQFSFAIENFARLLEYCDRYNVSRLLVLSAGDVYGARPGNSQFLSENAPLLAPEFSAFRDIDIMAQTFLWKRPDIQTLVLRPAHIAGAIRSAFVRYLHLSPVPMLLGYDPMVQLIHEEDLVDAILLALQSGRRGVYNVAGAGCLPLSQLVQMLGKTAIQVPHVLAKPALRHMNKLRMLEFHPAYVDYLRYVCMVDDAGIRADLGYRPKRSLAESVDAIQLLGASHSGWGMP